MAPAALAAAAPLCASKQHTCRPALPHRRPQIFRDLLPFRRRGGIREEEVEAVYAAPQKNFGGMGTGLIRYRVRLEGGQ